MPTKKWFRYVLGLLIGLGLLFGMARFIDLAHAMEESVEYPWPELGPVLALSLAYYLLKALRWHYLLSVIGIRLPLRRSLLTYLAGQWFAFSPAGEFVRAYLLAPAGVSFARGSAAVSIQVILDLLSLAIVATVGTLWFRETAALVLPFTALLVFIILVILHSRKLAGWRWFPSSIFSRIMARRVWGVFYEDTIRLLGMRPVLVGLALSIMSVLVGAAVLFLIALGYRIEINLQQSADIYSVSQLVGALSLLPHGLGVVEGSSVALYSLAGVNSAHAASAIVLFRLCTVGWGLLIGGLSLLSLRTRLAGTAIPRVRRATVMSDGAGKG